MDRNNAINRAKRFFDNDSFFNMLADWVAFDTGSHKDDRKSRMLSYLEKKIILYLGGTLPNDAFSKIIGMPTIWLPHSYAGCNQHAPNEHFLGKIARQGLVLMTGLFWDIAENKNLPFQERIN